MNFNNLELFGCCLRVDESNTLKTYTHRCEPSAEQKGRAISIFHTLCNCEPAEGGRGNPTLLSLRGFPQGKPWQSRIFYFFHLKIEIAVASLLAMTINTAVIARLPEGKAWQSSFSAHFVIASLP
jgi:hypothetical protein